MASKAMPTSLGGVTAGTRDTAKPNAGALPAAESAAAADHCYNANATTVKPREPGIGASAQRFTPMAVAWRRLANERRIER